MEKKILFFVILIHLSCFSQENANHKFKSHYTCEEIANIKDTLWITTTDKKIQKDSLGTIICARPFVTIDDKHKPLFVVLNNNLYVATIGSELKTIIQRSLKDNNCGKQIEIITQEEYLKSINSVRYKDPYKND